MSRIARHLTLTTLSLLSGLISHQVWGIEQSTETKAGKSEHMMSLEERTKAHRSRIDKAVASMKMPFRVNIAKEIPHQDAVDMKADLESKGFENVYTALAIPKFEKDGKPVPAAKEDPTNLRIEGFATRDAAQQALNKLKGLGISVIGIEEREVRVPIGDQPTSETK